MMMGYQSTYSAPSPTVCAHLQRAQLTCRPADLLPPACSMWYVNNRIAGYWKRYRTLSQVIIRNTGHSEYGMVW